MFWGLSGQEGRLDQYNDNWLAWIKNNEVWKFVYKFIVLGIYKMCDSLV